MTETMTPARSSAADVVALGLRACEAYQRPDLAENLHRSRRRLDDPATHVVVVGEFKKGKSSLVNGLVGANVCPVDDDVATALPTYVRYGAQPTSYLLTQEDDGPGSDVRREPVDLPGLRTAVLERHGDHEPHQVNGARVSGAEVYLPRPLLRGGLVLVDTPGVGGLGSAHATASLAAASMAQAVVFVTDAAQELSRAELEFLRQAQEMCGTVICALTKTDLHPSWRRIRDLTAGHLDRAGVDLPIIPVSTPVRALALQADDADLDAESGYPDLVRALAERVGADAEQRLASEARAAVVTTCTQLEAQFLAERAALADPEEAQRVVGELTRVKEQVQALKSAAARWNRTLTDGTADLNADIDHDLRRRIRDVLAEATAGIEESDPADNWPEMEAWLQARVSQEMLANFNLLRVRATRLSQTVGEHFSAASGDVLDRIRVVDPQATLASAEVGDKIDLDKMGLRKQAATVLKSGYGSTIMFVMMGAMLGVTLGPIAIGLALVMGTRGLSEEKKRQREARQRQAVASVRQYLDQIGFVMGKDSRDALRNIQRQLRDHYTELAEQLDRSNNEALRRATEAANRDAQQRKARLADVEAELGRLSQLRERASA